MENYFEQINNIEEECRNGITKILDKVYDHIKYEYNVDIQFNITYDSEDNHMVIFSDNKEQFRQVQKDFEEQFGIIVEIF